MFRFIMKFLVLFQLCSLSFGQSTLTDSLNVTSSFVDNIKGVKTFSISTTKFFDGPEGKKSRKLLESGIEHSIGMVIPTSFAVNNETIFIPSVPTGEIKSFSKNANFIKSYKLQCAETCEPNYVSFLQSGFFLVNTWNTSDLRVVDTTDGQALAWLGACSFKNWFRNDNFILCKKGQIWQDNQSIFTGQNKLNEPLTAFFDYYFLDSALVVSLYHDDNTKKLMYQLVNAQMKNKPSAISLPVEIDDYQAVHIIDGDSTHVRFILLSDDYKKDKIVLFEFCSKKTWISGLKIEYSGRPYIGEAATIWPGRVVYNAVSNNLYSLITDKDSITIYKYDIGALPAQVNSCK
ncbi:MAG: hypothetical protein J6W54_08360 [Fibrobacter sp.]|uniref:hypothetical protein n=1 Tax=Fibrobacter sp. TaxID=35828 RepID=UPI001B0A77CF|nr:hypothetical protein [Fibrobacter sp.]MBO7061086.1 hypothetical protein [Fibrobacter sp.]